MVCAWCLAAVTVGAGSAKAGAQSDTLRKRNHFSQCFPGQSVRALNAKLVERVEGKAGVEQIRALLELGASANADTDTEIGSVLHEAAYGGQTAVVELLLARGADPNKTNINDETPLSFAAVYGDVRMVRALLRKGARVILRRGVTVLFKAAGAVNIPVVKYLLTLPQIHINAEDRYGNTALSEACARNGNLVRLPQDDPRFEQKRMEFAQWLMAKGAHVNNRAGRSFALQIGLWSAALTRLLLSKGANPNTQDQNGVTPLHDAATGDDAAPECLSLLLAAHAKVNIRDKAGFTPLMRAEQADNQAAVQKLLAAGAVRSPKDTNVGK